MKKTIIKFFGIKVAEIETDDPATQSLRESLVRKFTAEIQERISPSEGYCECGGCDDEGEVELVECEDCGSMFLPEDEDLDPERLARREETFSKIFSSITEQLSKKQPGERMVWGDVQVWDAKPPEEEETP